MNWLSLTPDTPMPMLERRRVMGEQCMVSHITLRKGCVVPVHHHGNEQVVCVLSGVLRFAVADRAVQEGTAMGTMPGTARMVDVSAGEVLLLPANVPHGAEALEDAVALDVFAPPSMMTGIDRRG